MRDVVDCVALAVAIVTMAVFSSSGVCAASAPPTPQAGHQAAVPPVKAAPAEAGESLAREAGRAGGTSGCCATG